MMGYSLLVIAFLIILLTSISASAQIQGQWLTYTDPKGRFSLEYPSFIKMVPKQNRFETFDLTFSNENSSIRGHLVYGLSSDYTSPISPESLRRQVDGLNEVLKKVEQDYRVIETNETEINDNYAISQITYEKVYETENGVWKVYSIVNNRTFTFDYISSPTEFDKGLPTVEKMFNSIKFLN